MKHFLFVLFILLIGHFVHAADEAIELQPTVHSLLRRQGPFERGTFIARNDSRVQFTSEEQLGGIYQAVMEIPALLDDPQDGCIMRASSIKDALDKIGVWNKIIFLSVTHKLDSRNQIIFSPFVFGPERKGWNMNAAVVLASKGRDGNETLMVIDPVIFPEGPEPVQKWFNELVAGEKMYDKEHRKLMIYQNPDEPPARPKLKPTGRDLIIHIVDELPKDAQGLWRLGLQPPQ